MNSNMWLLNARAFFKILMLGFCANLFSAETEGDFVGFGYAYATSVYNDSPANYYLYDNPEYNFSYFSSLSGNLFLKTQLNYSKQIVSLLNHSTPQYITEYGNSFGLDYVIGGIAVFGFGTKFGLLKTKNGNLKGMTKNRVFEYGLHTGFGLNWQFGESSSLRLYNSYTWLKLHSSAFKKRENVISLILVFAY